MITIDQLAEIGRFAKPHGINGEIAASLDCEIDLCENTCVVTDIDGVYTPFFLENVRPKSQATELLKVQGIDSEKEATLLQNHTLYVLRRDFDFSQYDDQEPDGLYASDMVGFDILATGTDSKIGIIEGFNDDTDNALFIVATPHGDTVLIPVADEFITEIDTKAKTVTMDLPDGLLNL